MDDLGLQVTFWVMALVVIAAAIVWGLACCVLWVLDWVAGRAHRRDRPRIE